MKEKKKILNVPNDIEEMSRLFFARTMKIICCLRQVILLTQENTAI